jgi:predicted metal-dependent HD superfamily phosphohydrolase
MKEIIALDPKQIREVVEGFPPMAWMKDDRVLCVGSNRLLIRTFCETASIPITRRFDAWSMLCEPYLDTELSKEDDARTLAALKENGFEEAEVKQIRSKISAGMTMATFLSWEWQYYGLSDVRRHTGILSRLRHGRKEFERWTSEIACRPWKREISSGKPTPLVPAYKPPPYGLKARMQCFPNLLEPKSRRRPLEDVSRRWKSEEAIVETATRNLNDPSRHYHNIRHLEEALELGGESHRAQPRLELHPEWQKSKHYRNLWWAILFHDAIYVAGRSDNEELSAQLATETMRGHGMRDSDCRQVFELIMWTRHHNLGEAKSRELKAMHDGDLGIFGLWPARYAQYCEDVRKEWIDSGVVDNALFNRGRLAFLEKMSEQHRGRPFYFALNPFFSRLAGENISREIDDLRRLVA